MIKLEGIIGSYNYTECNWDRGRWDQTVTFDIGHGKRITIELLSGEIQFVGNLSNEKYHITLESESEIQARLNQVKPCQMDCPKCGSTVVGRKFLEKGAYFNAIDKDCIRNNCETCQYGWLSEPLKTL